MKTTNKILSAMLGAVLLAALAPGAHAQAPHAGAGQSMLQAPPPLTVQKSGAAISNRICPFCDLRGAKMANQDLSDANLQGANLQGADLSGANLSGAMLARANLSGANLGRARLGRTAKGSTDLSMANLSGATLTGATFDRSDLQYSNLSGVTGVNFGSAVIKPAVATPTAADIITCGNADLSKLQSRIYVSTTGADSGTCGTSVASACARISTGIGRCQPGSACGVLVLWGEYKPSGSIVLADGINVYGGCTAATPGAAPLQSLIDAPGGQPAMTAPGITRTPTIVQGFKLAGSTPASSGSASTAFLSQGSPNLFLIDMTVLAGNGAAGIAAATGPAGAAGAAGSGATAGVQAACSWTAGGNGSVAMGVTVDDSFFSYSCTAVCSANNCYGYWSYYGAAGGQWGNPNCTLCPKSRGDTGQPGASGADASQCGGKGTASGDSRGRYSGATWVPGAGNTGGVGGWGIGGGGGGSGGYKAGDCFGAVAWNGNQGGGGGSGGCGGSGGGGGGQGGASFGIAVVGNSLSVTNSTIVGGIGGAGAAGGTGGQGGNRGAGAGGLSVNDGGYGGTGGTGGAGGSGGGGAGGNGGPAVGVALVSAATIGGSGIAYYTGASGAAGGFGSGGPPIVAGLCTGANGDNGIAGVAADQLQY